MPGGGWISITVARTDVDATSARALGIDPGQYVRIAVADSGTGMDEETRLRCFEPLYTTKGPLKGTGLGLPTVRRVVLECGGAIRLETELGRGTTFDVYLPRIEEETGPSHVGDPVATSGPVQILDTSLEEVTVLLAEDDDDLRRLVRIVLLRAGCRVLEAADGVAALEIARAPDRVIDVLVSDVTMPGTSGREVALALRRDRPALAVLLVSGSTDEHVITDLGPGPTAFLAKPFKPSDVLASVRGLLVAEVHPSAADLSRSGVGETSFG
jgi:CheY-like chemotaxis protein